MNNHDDDDTPGHSREDMKAGDWSTFSTFTIGPGRVPFVIHKQIATRSCREPHIADLIATNQPVRLRQIDPHHFNLYAKYMYSDFEDVTYVQARGVLLPPGLTRDQQCEHAWETMAHLMLLGYTVGDACFGYGTFYEELDERSWEFALPSLRAIQLAYSIPGAKQDHENAIVEFFLTEILQAWVQRARYEDYVRLEEELPEQFKFDLLRCKLADRDNGPRRGR